MLLGEPISYFLFELLGLGLLIVCLHYASKHRHLTTYAATNELFMFFIYGFCLEVIAVRNNFYSYGVFRFQVLETPLVIASGWAVIGFSVMWFSDALNSPEWVKPFSDAMLALLIDLSMDTIAIRDIYGLKGESSGMWNWGIPFDSEWFGVPYGNLISWWVIVFLMSSSLRLGRYANRWFATRFLSYTYPIFAMVSALLVFLVLLFSFSEAFGFNALSLLILLSLIAIFANTQGFSSSLSWRKDLPVFLVPLSFHLYFLGLLLVHRLFLKTNLMTNTLMFLALAALFIHETIFWFGRKGIKKAAP